MLRSLFVVLAWVATGPARGSLPVPSMPPPDLNHTAAELAKALDVPGLAFAATNEQGMIASGVAGVRASDGTDPVRPDDRFHLGSLTKAMTATVAARIVERGLIRWDSTIGQVSPGLAEELPEHTRDLTLASLLTHRSGMPDDRNDIELIRNLWMFDGDITEQRFRASRFMLSRIEPSEEPPAFAYANANYVVAAHMLEVVTGRSWEDLIADELFVPLGLSSAGHGPPGMDADGAQPKGHARTPEGLTPMPALLGTDNPPVTGPAGRIHMSIDDLAAFSRAHLAGLRGHPGILAPATFRALHTPPEGESGYAFGWGVRAEPGERISSHAGSNTRWFALMFVMPDENLAVVVAMNATPDPAAQTDALGVIRSALKEAGLLPAPARPTEQPGP